MIVSVGFDWNGTLLADTTVSYKASKAALKALGGKQISLEDFRQTVVVPTLEFYLMHGCDENLMKADPYAASAAFHNVYEKLAAGCRTRKHARQVLEYLEQEDIQRFIVTNHTHEGVNRQLSRLGMEDLIDDVIANDDISPTLTGSSPKKDMLAGFLSEKGYTPGETMIVGDTEEEIEIGKELGIVTVAIMDGYHSEERLRSAGADHYISNLGQIIGIIDSVNASQAAGQGFGQYVRG
ncbi:HAD hydrolase-like protein [Candidatus Woesearchaeota archaeon]|nr:HAD hydrolase-like protein [Candidatus Woesearchaeota archaeon]